MERHCYVEPTENHWNPSERLGHPDPDFNRAFLLETAADNWRDPGCGLAVLQESEKNSALFAESIRQITQLLSYKE